MNFASWIYWVFALVIHLEVLTFIFVLIYLLFLMIFIIIMDWFPLLQLTHQQWQYLGIVASLKH